MSEPALADRGAARRQLSWLFGLALLLRVAVAVFAAVRFPPADDGRFYHQLASRIAAGDGYTWVWPDGVVTYAAHYPVGYPALLAGAYAVLGATPLSAMLVNAVLGSLLVVGVHECARQVTSLRRARLAALAVALHPTLILYTAALMTETAAASGLLLLTAQALSRKKATTFWRSLLLGVGGGMLVLVRPQLLPLLALLGAVSVWLPEGAPRRAALLARLRGAVEVLLISTLLCLPWTLRNCAKLDGCVFVSANGGWNLLIGTHAEGQGRFVTIAGATVPPECRDVFGEAGKDRCFGRAALRRVATWPIQWLRLVPKKLAQLFNHGAVASSYLHVSNPQQVSESSRLGLATVETLYSRLLLLAACFGLLRASGRPSERALAVAAGLLTLSPWGYLAQLGVLSALLAGRPNPGARPLRFMAAGVLGLTLLTHAVFFGAARYALIWLPWLALLLVLPQQKRAES